MDSPVVPHANLAKEDECLRLDIWLLRKERKISKISSGAVEGVTTKGSYSLVIVANAWDSNFMADAREHGWAKQVKVPAGHSIVEKRSGAWRPPRRFRSQGGVVT
jgi:hypothetical protein